MNYKKPRNSLLRLLDPEQSVDSFLLEQEIDKLVDRPNARHQGQDPPRLFDAPVEPPHIRRSVVARALQNIYSSTPVAKKLMPDRFTDEFSSISSFNGTECGENKNQPSNVVKRSIGQVIVINSSSSQEEANPLKKSFRQEAAVSRGPNNVLPSSSKCTPRQTVDGAPNCSDQENAHSHHDRSSRVSNYISQNESKTDTPAVDDIPMPPPRMKRHLKVLLRQEPIETETLIVPETNKMTTRSRSLENAGLKVAFEQLQIDSQKTRSASAGKELKDGMAREMEDLQRLKNKLKNLAEEDCSTNEDSEKPPDVMHGSYTSKKMENEKSIKDSAVSKRVENASTSVERGRRKGKIPTRKSMPRSKSDHRPDAKNKEVTDEKSVTSRERDCESKRDLEQKPQQVDRNEDKSSRGQKGISQINRSRNTSVPATQNGKDSMANQKFEEVSTANKDVEDDASPVREKKGSRTKATTEKTTLNEREDLPDVGMEESPKEDCGATQGLEQEAQEREIELVQTRGRVSKRSLLDSPEAKENNKSALVENKKTSRIDRSRSRLVDDDDAKGNETCARDDSLGRTRDLPGKTAQAGVTPKSSSILNRGGTPRSRKSVTFVDDISDSSDDNEIVTKPPAQNAKSPNVTYRKSNLAAAAAGDPRCRSEEFEGGVEQPSPPREGGETERRSPRSKNKSTFESRRRKLDSDSEPDTEPKRMRDDCKSKRQEEKHRKRPFENVQHDLIGRRNTRMHRRESSCSDSFEERRAEATAKRNKIEENRKLKRLDSSESDSEYETVKSKRREKRYNVKQRYDRESESNVSEQEETKRKRAFKKNVYYEDRKRLEQRYNRRYDSESELEDRGRPTSPVFRERAQEEKRKNRRFERHHGNRKCDSDLDQEDFRQVQQLRSENKDLRRRKNGHLSKSNRVAYKRDRRRRRPREHDQSYSSDSEEETYRLNVADQEIKKSQRGGKCKRGATSIYDEDRLLIKYHDREDEMTSSGEDDGVHQQKGTVDVQEPKNMVDVGTSPLNLDADVAVDTAEKAAVTTSREKGRECEAKEDEGGIALENPVKVTTPVNPKSDRLHRLISDLVERKSGNDSISNGSSKKNRSKSGTKSPLASRKRLSVAMFNGRELAPKASTTEKDRNAWLQRQQQQQYHRDGSYSNSESSTNSRLLKMFYTGDDEYNRQRENRGRSPRLYETTVESVDMFRFSWDDELDLETEKDMRKEDNCRPSGHWRLDGLPPLKNYVSPGAALKMGFPYRCEADISKDSAGCEKSWTIAEVIDDNFVPQKKISLTPFQPPAKKNIKKATSKVYQKKKLFEGTNNKVNSSTTKILQEPSTSTHENRSNTSGKLHEKVTEERQRSSSRSSRSKSVKRAQSPTGMSRKAPLEREDEVEDHQEDPSSSKSIKNRSQRSRSPLNISHRNEDKLEECRKIPSSTRLTRNRVKEHQNEPEDGQRSQSPLKMSQNPSHQREDTIEECEKRSSENLKEHQGAIEEGDVVLTRSRRSKNLSANSKELEDVVEEKGETSANLRNQPDAMQNGVEESSKRSVDRLNEAEDFHGFSSRDQDVAEECCGSSGRSRSRRKKSVSSRLVDGGTQTSSKRCNHRCADGSGVQTNPEVVVERMNDDVPTAATTSPCRLPTSRRLDFPADEEDRRRRQSRTEAHSLTPMLPVIEESGADDHQEADQDASRAAETQAAKSSEKVDNDLGSSTTSTRNNRRKGRFTEPKTTARKSTKKSASVTQDNIISSDAAENTGVRRSGRERRPPNPGTYRCIILVKSERELKSFNKELSSAVPENDVTTVMASTRRSRLSDACGSRQSAADRRSASVKTSLPANPATLKTARRTRKHAADSTVTDVSVKRTKGREKVQRASKKPAAEEECLPPPLQDNTCDSGMGENGTMSVTLSAWPNQDATTSTGIRKTQQRRTVSGRRSRSRSNENCGDDDATDLDRTDGGVFEKLSSITYDPLNEQNKDLLTGTSELLDNVNHVLVLPGGQKPLHRTLKSNLGFIVMYGNALVRVGRNYAHVTNEERFKVPKGEIYMIKNMSDEEPLKLLCIKI